MTNNRLPIFIISFNRGAYLRQIISSYATQSIPIDIVVHDNGSDDLFTLQALSELEKEGIAVHRYTKINSVDELNRVEKSIRRYFGWFRKRSRYVVTDCDIDLSTASPDALKVYSELLDRFPDIECVGPMLTIEDIPEDYQLYNRVMNRHIEQFWHQKPEVVNTCHGQCAFIKAQIDTTFALHREETKFRRMKNGLRVYKPFEARHLDWYPQNLDSAYQQTSSADISHWNNADQLSEFATEPLHYSQYNVIDMNEDNSLTINLRQVKSSTSSR